MLILVLLLGPTIFEIPQPNWYQPIIINFSWILKFVTRGYNMLFKELLDFVNWHLKLTTFEQFS